MSEDRSSSLSLNEDFQKFLEASLSSDESELDLSENKKQLWWLDGEDDGNVKQKESANRHSWLKKVETKKTDEDQKDSDSQTIKEIIESKSAVQETTSQDKEVENLSSKQESEAGKENVFTFDSKSHVSEKPEILTSDDQTLVQSLPDDDYSEDTFNTLTSKDEIAEEESNISSHITSETTKNPNENSTNNSEKVEIISSPVLPRLKEQENKAEKTEIKSTVDLLPEADDLIDKKNDHMNHVDSAIVNDLKDDDEKLPTLKSSEESKIESKEVNEIINQPIKQFEIDETNVKEISKDDDYDKVLDREKDLLQKLSKFQNLYYEEQKENVKLKSRLLNVEKEIENKLLEQRLQLEENTNKLHQEKIILSARLEEIELHHSSSNKFSNEEISSMKQCIDQQEKELKEQERLLQGYQQENERLYLELKTVQKQKKLNEGKHKTQIEKLHSELIRVKEQLYLRERASNFKLKEVEKSENTSNIEKNNDENAKGEIIQINEDESLKQTLSMKQEEISKLKAENEVLNLKLKEFNKKMSLNTTRKDLLKKEQEINKLTEHIKILEKEKASGKKMHMQNQNKDQKKIKELENKVSDLEKVIEIQQEQLQKSNENIKSEAKPSDIVNCLEDKIQKLQQELETKDHQSKQNLKELEQQYRDIKLGYEKRMKTVESQYQQQINILEKKLIESGSVQQGNNSVQIFPKTSQSSQCSILDWKRWDYIVAENRDLVMKSEKLKIEIEELRTEYKKVKEEAGRIISETQHETQEMISKMRSEMEDLKMEHEKSEIRARTLIRNAQKESQEMAKQLKTLHVRHLQQAWIENISSAKTYSEDYQKIADLTNKLETKEIIINQLKLKIEEYEEEKEKIKILEMRNSDLEDKLKELNITLNRIISSQNPQQKEISLLKEEIRILDRRHKSREEEIQKLLFKLKQQDSKYLKKEVEKWQQRVIDKNKEIEGFREELDVILRFLEELKQQGITIPRARSAVL